MAAMLAFGLACGGGLGGVGAPCQSSEDCGPGLLCDHLASPPACAGMEAHPDQSVSPNDLAGTD
jgi:hypothetical protein